MPRKAKSNGNSGFANFTFIDVRLAASDKKWLAAADLSVEYPMQDLFGLVQEGYKCSVAPDPKNGGFIVSLIDVDPESDFTHHVISGRGPTPLDAWYALAYKHFRLAQRDWSNFAGRGDSDTGGFG